MGKSIRHLRFRGRFEQRMGIFQKIIGGPSETFESALPGLRDGIRFGQASSARSDRGTEQGFVSNSFRETGERRSNLRIQGHCPRVARYRWTPRRNGSFGICPRHRSRPHLSARPPASVLDYKAEISSLRRPSLAAVGTARTTA